MPSPTIGALEKQVAASLEVEASAIILINGLADRIQTAVDKALKGGATEAELAPLQAEIDRMKASAESLSAAVVANTPAA